MLYVAVKRYTVVLKWCSISTDVVPSIAHNKFSVFGLCCHKDVTFVFLSKSSVDEHDSSEVVSLTSSLDHPDSHVRSRRRCVIIAVIQPPD